jgi:hypothetical protein
MKRIRASKGGLALALIFLLTAIGVVLFWVNWFTSGSHLLAGDEYYRAYENTFPFPDGAMAILLAATALALLIRSRAALFTGMVACGMLLYLASLDTLYNLMHGGFADLGSAETWEKLFISGYCYLLGMAGAAALWRLDHTPLDVASRIPDDEAILPAGVWILRTLLRAMAFILTMRWILLLVRTVLASSGAGAPTVDQDFNLAAVFGAQLGIATHRPTALAWLLVHGGMSLFRTVIRAAFIVENAHRVTPEVAALTISSLVPWVVYTLLVFVLTWRARDWFLPSEMGIVSAFPAGSKGRANLESPED